MTSARSYKLVLANGTFKSGSTWLKDVVNSMMAFEKLPKEFYYRSDLSWIHPDKIQEVIRSEQLTGPFLSKSHIFHASDIQKIKNEEAIKILLITRDIKDVIVSAYYHFRRVWKIPFTFGQYYWLIGRLKSVEVLEYDKNWVDVDRVYRTTFRSLKYDFENEVKRLAAFLEIPPDQIDIPLLKEQTRFENIVKKRKQDHLPEAKRFYRKGEVGDWKNHFNDSISEDLKKIETNQYGIFTLIAYFFCFRIRRMKFSSRQNR